MKHIARYGILLTAFGAGCGQSKENTAPAPAAIHYLLATVEKAGVAAELRLPAQLAAYQEVSIFPKVNGYVKSVLVDIGTHVAKGQTLMTLVAPELDQAVLQARERYERSRSGFLIDRENYQRLLQAAQTPGAVSPFDLSTARSKTESDSSLANAERANWEMQQTMEGYLRVTAPFEGVITERNVHPGALVSSAVKDKPMLELKQADHLRLEVDVPEASAGALHDNDRVSFSTSALPGKKIEGRISRRSMNINTSFRSERIEIDVANKEGQLAPGMYAEVRLHTTGNINALSVPGTAVVISTEKKYVLAVRNGRLTRVDVETGNESGGRVEIYGALQAGEQVIAKANEEMKDGGLVN